MKQLALRLRQVFFAKIINVFRKCDIRVKIETGKLFFVFRSNEVSHFQKLGGHSYHCWSHSCHS